MRLDIVLLKELIKVEEFLDNPVLIMAGGIGSRLRPFTENCPKPMLKVGDKPILEILIEQFIENGFSNFYISVNYLKEQIIKLVRLANRKTDWNFSLTDIEPLQYTVYNKNDFYNWHIDSLSDAYDNNLIRKFI